MNFANTEQFTVKTTKMGAVENDDVARRGAKLRGDGQRCPSDFRAARLGGRHLPDLSQ